MSSTSCGEVEKLGINKSKNHSLTGNQLQWIGLKVDCMKLGGDESFSDG